MHKQGGRRDGYKVDAEFGTITRKKQLNCSDPQRASLHRSAMSKKDREQTTMRLTAASSVSTHLHPEISLGESPGREVQHPSDVPQVVAVGAYGSCKEILSRLTSHRKQQNCLR